MRLPLGDKDTLMGRASRALGWSLAYNAVSKLGTLAMVGVGGFSRGTAHAVHALNENSGVALSGFLRRGPSRHPIEPSLTRSEP
jgi:hypothetical protein